MTLGWICSDGCPWLEAALWVALVSVGLCVLFVASGLAYLISKRGANPRVNASLLRTTKLTGVGAAVGVVLLIALLVLMQTLDLL